MAVERLLRRGLHRAQRSVAAIVDEPTVPKAAERPTRCVLPPARARPRPLQHRVLFRSSQRSTPAPPLTPATGSCAAHPSTRLVDRWVQRATAPLPIENRASWTMPASPVRAPPRPT